MGSLAVQTAVGEIGSKATTEISYSFNSMINIAGSQWGCNKNGLYELNSGEDDNGVPYERSFTLAKSDFGSKHQKNGRMLYLGIDTDHDLSVGISFDGQAEKVYPVAVLTTGLQRVRVPIGTRARGRYCTIRFFSNHWFRIDSVKGLFFEHSSGIGGY